MPTPCFDCASDYPVTSESVAHLPSSRQVLLRLPSSPRAWPRPLFSHRASPPLACPSPGVLPFLPHCVYTIQADKQTHLLGLACHCLLRLYLVLTFLQEKRGIHSNSLTLRFCGLYLLLLFLRLLLLSLLLLRLLLFRLLLLALLCILRVLAFSRALEGV